MIWQTVAMVLSTLVAAIAREAHLRRERVEAKQLQQRLRRIREGAE